MRPPNDSADKPVSQRDDLRHWLALHRAPAVGATRFRKLLDMFGSPVTVFDAAAEQLRMAGIPVETIDYLNNPDWTAVDRDLDWLQHENNHVITYQDPRYPALLREIPDPPALLFVHGDPDYLSQPQLAIVGSRNPSHQGRALAREFAAHLASYGLTITSGLASGIDGAAHQGALDGGGSTVAVTGTGLDRVYPAQHRELAHDIARNGALVSEFPLGTAPVPSNFPRRNRLISGLSVGTLVVEAALRSGSLITAHAALDQGREVFAIPGSIHNPLARGCHALIRQGAKLVETGDHILEELAPLILLSLSENSSTDLPSKPDESLADTGKLTPEYSQLLDLIGHDSVSVDQLVDRSGLTPEEVSSMLLLLELDNYLISGPGGRYTRTR